MSLKVLRKGAATLRDLQDGVIVAGGIAGSKTITTDKYGNGDYLTAAAGVSAVANGDILAISAGAYYETLTVNKSIGLVGLGGRGSAAIGGVAAGAEGVKVTADDVTMVNVGVFANASADYALNLNAVSRFRAYGCKFEGPDGTVVLLDGSATDQCADILFEDCEFAWGGSGVIFDNSDYGYPTQIFFRHCRFHNLTAAALAEAAGGGVNDIHMEDCIFGNLEDGSNPTKFINLVGSSNSGIVTRCSFPVAINSGLNLVDTGIVWSSNFHTGGVSTGQPS